MRSSCSNLNSSSSNVRATLSRTQRTSLRAVSSPRRRSSSLILITLGAFLVVRSSTESYRADCDLSSFRRGAFYRNVVRISRLVTARQSQQTFGFKLECVDVSFSLILAARTHH